MDPDHPGLPVVRQCAPLSISCSGYYDEPVGDSAANLALMWVIYEQFLEKPLYGP